MGPAAMLELDAALADGSRHVGPLNRMRNWAPGDGRRKHWVD
jgi:hypothetical protein